MRYARFSVDDQVYAGTVTGENVEAGGQRWSLGSIRLLAPCLPTKIIGIGRNYAEHAAELGNKPPVEPLLFFKPPSAVTDPGGDIVYPPQSQRVDYEGELAVVISARCRRVRRADAAKFILGYTICNDITARDLQQRDGQWARAKGFDTFAPLGPWVESDIDPGRLRIRTLVNDHVRQEASTDQMIFDVPALIEYVSAAFTLEAGDVIATGTPSGVGPLSPGDVVRVEIDGIGVLTNHVVAAGA